MNHLSVWISALRLRTLPLAAASIIVAAGIAVNQQVFDTVIFLLSLSTALLLQILSNLANDYGDALLGADNETRVGPKRAMQSGVISAKKMKKAILLTVFLTLFSGIALLLVALGDDLYSWLLFLGLGLLAIVAAITYTMGKLPYGYHALGDFAVFLFFGLLGVIGSFYLYNLSFHWALFLPAISVGLFSSAVLNINNIRDYYSDQTCNKTTLVVKIGRHNAFYYHLLLVGSAPLLSAGYIYQLEAHQAWQYSFLLILSPIIKNSLVLRDAVLSNQKTGEVFNEQLRNMAMTTFSFALLLTLVLVA